MARTKRLKPEVRKAQILRAALQVAEERHYAYMTRDQIAKRAGVQGTTVQHYLGTMANLRRTVMRVAIQERCYAIIVQGIFAKDARALRSPAGLQAAATDWAFDDAGVPNAQLRPHYIQARGGGAKLDP